VGCLRMRGSFVGVGLLLAVSACGGNGSEVAAPPPEVAIRTLAYGVTECREDAQALSGTQRLVIQQGGREVTIREGQFGPLPALGLCPAYAYSRFGDFSAVTYPLQRLGVSPDGSMVVFEVTDEHSILAPFLPEGFLPPEEKGIFLVQADGTGLRRLGEASREPCTRFAVDPSTPTGFNANAQCWRLLFSPDGRTIAFTDMGPDATGQEAAQVFTMDIASGARTQITHLAPQTPRGPVAFTVILGRWLRDGVTLGFATNSVVGGRQEYTVKADGTEEPMLAPRPAPVALPGAELIPEFRITETATRLFVLALSGTEFIPQELFVAHGEDMLQLTSFGRSDTGAGGSILDLDEQWVLFTASADPFGTNPDENCQLFSVDTLAGDLRQLTRWGEGQHSMGGCSFYLRPGCKIDGFERERRPGPDTAIFYSTCDPFGTNPDGGQLFAVRSDGTGLRQLTQTRGVVAEADGTATVELPGTWAYPQTWD
jgi:hypothetical protein